MPTSYIAPGDQRRASRSLAEPSLQPALVTSYCYCTPASVVNPATRKTAIGQATGAKPWYFSPCQNLGVAKAKPRAKVLFQGPLQWPRPNYGDRQPLGDFAAILDAPTLRRYMLPVGLSRRICDEPGSAAILSLGQWPQAAAVPGDSQPVKICICDLRRAGA